MADLKLINIDQLINRPRTPLTTTDVYPPQLYTFNQSKMNFNKDLQLKGKYCYHPFNSVTINTNGDCFVCICQAWLPISVGNILDFNSLSEIVHSPKAREIQASILDGTYKYCDHHTCHLIAHNELETRLNYRPDTVNWIVFAIDDSCNLSCPSCRTELVFHKNGAEFERRMQISNHLINIINQHTDSLKFTLSGDGDPFASHIYSNMLEKLNLSNNKNIEIEIVTNGILIKSHWSKMSGVHNNVTRFKISFDAGSPEVYNITRRGGDWNKLIENCKYIIEWRKKHSSRMKISANFVLQNSNYRDIHKFVEITDTLGFDSIIFQKVTDWGKWNTNGINYFAEHAVWMPSHSNFNELMELINNPILSNPKVQLTNLIHLKGTK